MGTLKSYSPPMLNGRQKKALDDGIFNFLFPAEKRHPLYSIPETSLVLQIGTESVRRLVHDGKLEAHAFTLVTRHTFMVTRRSIERLLASTSNYSA